jgi:LmbE family N-acetylglucosaminyl deacetylase
VAAGKSVAYVIVTRGEAGIDSIEPDAAGPMRMAEERASAAAVGVSSVTFLDHRIDRGIASLREQRIYLEHLDPAFDPEAFLREQAQRVGRRAGVPLAVEFEVYQL